MRGNFLFSFLFIFSRYLFIFIFVYFLDFIFLWHFCLYYDKTDQSWQEVKRERERGWDQDRTRDACLAQQCCMLAHCPQGYQHRHFFLFFIWIFFTMLVTFFKLTDAFSPNMFSLPQNKTVVIYSFSCYSKSKAQKRVFFKYISFKKMF